MSTIARLAKIFVFVCFGAGIASAVTVDEAEQLFHRGDYAETERVAAAEVERGVWNERWPRLLIRCQMVLGEYANAKDTYENAIRRHPTSLTIRMLGIDVLKHCSLPEEADAADASVLRLLQSSPSTFMSRDNLLATGRYLAMRGEDARQILELYYDRVRDVDPQHLEVYIATAELALEKGDYQVAAETLRAAQQLNQTDPRIDFLLARAWRSSDSAKATEALNAALKRNPNHLPSLLFQASSAIDREQYKEAESILDRVLAINDKHQEAIAMQAVIAHLYGDYEKEKQLRDVALTTWKNNPRVDHWIGRKLSQKYRFEEGAAYQRRALAIDPSYNAASFQLAQDLLRLGHDDVGWQLAEQVSKQDQYNVVAHNLITLHDRLKGFAILERDGIQVRMEKREAAIYGQEVMELLGDAKRDLCKKYDIEPRDPIVVEIFPEQKDFAIRTFGLPGGAGFLGVCFGRVITANSPASQGDSPANWRSVLWHEFCHVVTLEKTKNRMPRWLSEGISVYEERARNAAWGQSMTPQYREMLLADNLTPVSKLSGAFLNPPSPIHLQFAYFESSLVIDFLIEKHGLDALKAILDDLGNGLTISDALAKNVGSIDKLDSQFRSYARNAAESFGKDADWSQKEISDESTVDDLQALLKEKPNHYWGLRRLAEKFLSAGEFEKARPLFEKIYNLNATTGQSGDPLESLAFVYRKLNEPQKEEATLKDFIAKSCDSLPTLRRLIEISKARDDWRAVGEYASQMISINPMLAEGQLSVAEAAEKQNDSERVVRAVGALNQLEPVDPAGLDYRMAQALMKLSRNDEARTFVLRALEEAPRYRDAHRLLLKLEEEASGDETTETKGPKKAMDSTK